MKILVLGGTKFLGRATVEAALNRGHDVTLFNRGTTNAELFPGVEKLRGDRTGDLSTLAGRHWDAVVDPSGYVPHVVRRSAEALDGSVGRYLFVSSISVYADLSAGPSEDSPRADLGDMPVDELLSAYENYGPLKALCEDAAWDVFGDGATVVRPGLIVGPHDPTGRFTYWPHRIARGGDVLVPGPAWREVQLVDVRDLAAWIVTAAVTRLTGPFNASGPTTLGAVVDAARRVTGASARSVEVDDAFLARHEVGEWMELPLWVDTRNEDWRRFLEVDVTRAVEAGLGFRPLDETVAATLEHAHPVDGVGLTPEREAELLAAWWSRGV